MSPVYLETKRLILRQIESTDVANLFALDSDPLVHRFLGNEPLKTIDQVPAIINHINNQYTANGYGRLAVELKDSGEFMGWSGLKHETEIRDFNYTDLGYRLMPKYWGNGYATESSIAALDWGFKHLNTDLICAAVAPGNVASQTVLQKLHFEEKKQFDVENLPHHWFAMTRGRWFKKESVFS